MPELHTGIATPPESSLATLEPQGRLYKRLNAAHLQMAEFMLAGKTTQEIAVMMNRSPNNISTIVNQPIFQEHLARRREQQNARVDTTVGEKMVGANAILQRAEVAAALTMEQLLDAGDDNVKFRSAKDILDRQFGPGASKNQVNVTVINADQLTLLLTALREDAEAA